MSDLRQNIVFPGSGMDTDSSLEYVANGDGRERRNILVGGDEANGILINMFGNERPVNWSDVELNLSYCYRVIGSHYNRLQRAVYYFVFSLPYELESGGASSSSTTTTTTTTESGDLDIDYTSGTFEYDNMLLRYWEDTRTIDIIFRDRRNYFGLHYDYPMKDITMIGDWLYFNPRVSDPKFIDVEMAYNYTNYDAYDPTLTYVYGDYVTYYGGLFMANVAIGVGETPVNTEAKWDRIGDSYQDETKLSFDSEFRYAFNVIKLPPITRPSIAYATDSTINSNNIRGKVVKFTYRYQYFDNSYSVFSAFSKVSLPLDDEQWNGEILGNANLNNYLTVDINLHSAALVKSVEIFFQTIGADWRRCKIVNRREQTVLTEINYTYSFYNNEAYEVYADPAEILKIHDAVPLKSNSQEIINKNILCYGGVTEGFDNIPKEDIDVTLTPVARPIIEIFEESNPKQDNLSTGDGDYTYLTEETDEGYNYITLAYYAVLDLNDFAAWGIADGDAFKIVADGVQNVIILGAADIVSAEAIADAIYNGFYHAYLWIDQTHNVDGELWIGSLGMYPVITVSRFYTPDALLSTKLSKYNGFKTGAFHPFCIFYYDESMRRCDSQTSKESINTTGYTYDGTTVYVPMFTETSPVLDEKHRYAIEWTINHQPPDYAKFWRWGYAGNSLCSYFVQYIIDDIDDGSDEESNMTVVDISPLQTIKYTTETNWNQFPASNIDAYTWEKGDRVRFLTEAGDNATPGTDLGAFLGAVYDYEIIKQGDSSASAYSKYYEYDPTVAYAVAQRVKYNGKAYEANAGAAVGETPGNTPGKWDELPDPFYSIYVQKFDYAEIGIGKCSLIEIYRPAKETTHEVYYEFGDMMSIVYDSAGVKAHEGILTNQDSVLGTAASGTFETGDVYHIFRTPSLPLDSSDLDQAVFHESMWWSDFYKSDDWDRGKAGVESNFGERYLNIIRYSNQYLQNTGINGLSTFDGINYKELNDVFGDIVAIYELGDTLRCYQKRKASSILIGRTEYNDADGNATVAISTSVLGAIRYSTTNFSTVFPECISRNNKFIYGFDIYNGVVFRDTTNGIFPISGKYVDANGESDYRMAHYFKDKSKALLESGIDHCDVMSVWDEEFKNLYIIFKDYVEESNNETIVFHEPSNRWICYMDLDQTPPFHNEFLEPTYEITQGFEGGIGYSFDEDTRFAMFDIQAANNRTVTPDTISMTMTPYDPTPSDESEGSQDNISMSATVYAPTIHISFITLDPYSAEWTYNQYDSANTRTISITTNGDAAVVDGVPVWLTAKNETLHTITNGVTTVNNGEHLYLYPTAENTGNDRSGTITLTDAYGNTASLSVIQYGDSDPDVYLSVDGGELFTIDGNTDGNTYVNIASTTLHVGFEIHSDDPDFPPGTVSLDAIVYKNGGYYMTTTVNGRLEYFTSDTITLADAAAAYDSFSIILSYDLL